LHAQYTSTKAAEKLSVSRYSPNPLAVSPEPKCIIVPNDLQKIIEQLFLANKQCSRRFTIFFQRLLLLFNMTLHRVTLNIANSGGNKIEFMISPS
jgi:hypothetical protein